MKIKYDIRHDKTVGANVYFNIEEFILFYKILSDFVHPTLPDVADLKLGEEMYDGILTPEEYKNEIDKWQKLKDFLIEGKQNLPKDVYVSRPSVFGETLDIMEELEKREFSELKGENNE